MQRQLANRLRKMRDLLTPRLFLAAIAATILLYFHQTIVRFAWYHLGGPISRFIHLTLRSLSGSETIFRYTPQDALQIEHGDVLLRITRSCSGLDGWYLFTLAALLIWGFNLTRRSRSGWASFYLGGLAVVHLLNCARIATLLLLATWILPALGVQNPQGWVQDFAHPFLGTLAYVIGLSVYCALLDRGGPVEKQAAETAVCRDAFPLQLGAV